MRSSNFSVQITRLSLLLAAVVIIVVGSLGWWAAARIDEISVTRETRAILVGLDDVAQRVPVEQDSSAIWDDAVINMRENNDAWIAENLAEWMSEYFGHDLVYLLSPTSVPVRAVVSGERNQAVMPLRNARGEVLGLLSWKPYRPAFQLLVETAPALLSAGLIGALSVLALFWRLRQTSKQLEMSEATARYLAFHDLLARIEAKND